MVKTLVRDASELSDLLERIYGERIEINPLEEYIGNIDATLDTIKFKITFRTDHYLIISTKKSSKEIIDKLFSLLTKVMGGEKPICRYDLPQLESDIIEDEEVLEWDIATPEERLKEIVNGIAFPGCEKIYNLKLYNGREISYYLEKEEEKKERIENTKIYGIYPGSIEDTEVIKDLTEVQLFMYIRALESRICTGVNDMMSGIKPEFNLIEEQFALEYLKYQTTKFGVELSNPSERCHIAETPSYKSWFKFYRDHFENVLTIKEWDEFQKAFKNGEYILKYLPTGSWKELYEKSFQKTMVKKD